MKIRQDELEEKLLSLQIQPTTRIYTDKPGMKGKAGIDPVAPGLPFGPTKVDAIVGDERPIAIQNCSLELPIFNTRQAEVIDVRT
jgi:hypothetical protein